MLHSWDISSSRNSSVVNSRAPSPSPSVFSLYHANHRSSPSTPVLHRHYGTRGSGRQVGVSATTLHSVSESPAGVEPQSSPVGDSHTGSHSTGSVSSWTDGPWFGARGSSRFKAIPSVALSGQSHLQHSESPASKVHAWPYKHTPSNVIGPAEDRESVRSTSNETLKETANIPHQMCIKRQPTDENQEEFTTTEVTGPTRSNELGLHTRTFSLPPGVASMNAEMKEPNQNTSSSLMVHHRDNSSPLSETRSRYDKFLHLRTNCPSSDC